MSVSYFFKDFDNKSYISMSGIYHYTFMLIEAILTFVSVSVDNLCIIITLELKLFITGYMCILFVDIRISN